MGTRRPLQAALRLARLPVEVTLVDRRNFHLFQPLAYQVATGALSPAEICYPLRRIFRSRPNVRIVLAEADDIDLDAATTANAGQSRSGRGRDTTLGGLARQLVRPSCRELIVRVGMIHGRGV